MDAETQKIVTEQSTLKSFVGSDGWKLARGIAVQKILELQDAFQIVDGEPQKMLIDLQARKLASSTLFDILRIIEGNVQQAEENNSLKESHIIRL